MISLRTSWGQKPSRCRRHPHDPAYMSPERSAAVPTSAEGAASAAAPTEGAPAEAQTIAGLAGSAAAPAQTTVAPAEGAPAPTVAAAADHDGAAICANCGAVVSGEFCSRCGQRRAHAMHSVLHFSSEVLEDLTHADSRLWSTIVALLFKPG